ncbi:MAG: hypothetical protein FJX65_17230 [Alphaproteobacteria bacterium]|nr:hypothetical protein [Alphaproteobacteria bacterium]
MAIGDAGAEPRGMVTEYEAKVALAAAGFPVTLGHLSESEDAAVQAAEQVGFPVVLKVSAPDILHKTEVGGVRVNLTTAQAVRDGYRAIAASVRAARGAAQQFRILVDSMAIGHEFFIGATRSEFGPLLLFGLGGVMTEVFRDVAYGLAPLSMTEARRMIRSTKASALFSDFRGTPAVSQDAMAQLLVKAAQFLVERPDITELDLNPIIARGDSLRIADARFMMALPPSTGEPPREPTDATVDQLYAPRSIAVVGVTTGRYNRGRTWMRSVQKAGFVGPLHAVSRKESVDDFPTVASLDDLPAVPDLVMIEVGRQNVPEVLRQCVARKVPWVAIRASGFGEDGTEEGRELRRELIEIVRGSSTYIVGPSALGPYAPAAGIVPDGASRRPGGVGFLTQSGVVFLALGRIAQQKCFGISRAISFGSEADVGIEVHLRGLRRDQATELVACHVEGVRHPVAFARELVATAREKPVLVVKGGRTALGARAVQSHSGAMTSPGKTWDALCDKAGALMVDDFDDLVDHVVAFKNVRGPFGRRLAFVTPSGGQGVLFADECDRHDFTMPALTEDTERQLAAVLSAGTSIHNPLDFAAEYFQPKVMTLALALVAADPNVDAIVFHIAIDLYAVTAKYAEWVKDAFVEVLSSTAGAILGKPVITLMPHLIDDALRAEVERRLLEAGVAVFPTAPRLLRAIGRIQRFREAKSSGADG